MMGGSPEYQAFMMVVAACGAVLALVFALVIPMLLRRRRKRDQQVLHDRIAKATSAMLEDGVVERPAGPYVTHTPWGVGTEVGTPTEGGPRPKGYHGGPWPKA